MMRKLLVDIVWTYFRTMGLFERSEDTIEGFMDRAGVIAIYQKWLEEWIRLFEAETYLKSHHGVLALTKPRELDQQTLWNDWEKEKESWLGNENLKSQIVLIDAVLKDLVDILTGKKLSTQIIFPNSSVELVEGVYKNNPIADYFNQALSNKIIDYVKLRLAHESSPNIRIIEVGAGTGATSALVLKKLKNYQHAIKEYCYTDISNAFLNHAEKSYGADNPFLTYGILNIEKEIADQNYDTGAYDIVIGSNVLHATKNVRITMRHVKSLLKKNGLVFMNEFVINSLFSHMTFGLLEGWWYYEDQAVRLSGSPGLDEKNWRKVLKDEGFRSTACIVNSSQGLEQQIIIAESDGFIRVAQRKQDDIFTPTNVSPIVAVERNKQEGSETVEAILLVQLADSLRIDKHKIEIDEPFSTYGLDSILAVSLTKTINEKLGIELDVTALFEHSTIGQLSDFVMSEFCSELAALITASKKMPEQSMNSGTLVASAGNKDATFPSPAKAMTIENTDIDVGDIAIIGVNGRFPEADNLEEFWQNLEIGCKSIRAVPLTRKDWDIYRNEALGKIFDIDNIQGGFLNQIHEFDPLFFNISITEAQQMTPEQRLMLMCIWNAVENAGYTPKMLSRQLTGVFIATGPSEYYQAQEAEEAKGAPGLLSTPSLAMMPNRISYHFNLQGPSEYFDTTCSSSFTALNRAVRSLQDGECQYALVGGINLIMSPMGFLNLDAVGMLSKTADVKPFQKGADGTVRGEGVGGILLKPMREALKDNDHIYAVIKGTGVAHGGKGVSMTAPNIQGMKMAMRQAYQRSGVDPASISYIEAHGMSTSLADDAEIVALQSFFSEQVPDRTASLYVTTLKPCIGHTEVVSGMAALFRTIMAMNHKIIPSIANFGEVNNTKLFAGALQLVNKSLPWNPVIDNKGRTIARRACINSFGVSGVNAHVVLEEAPSRPEAPKKDRLEIIILSARDSLQLAERATDFLQFCNANKHFSLSDLAATLQFGRVAMPSRLAIIARSIDDLITTLGEYQSGYVSGQLIHSEAPENQHPQEIFSGQLEEKTIQALWAEQNYIDIARLWCNGANLDWSLITDVNYRKIPLPAYPFKQIDCWFSKTIESKQDVDAGTTSQSILTLIFSHLGIASQQVELTHTLADYGLNSLFLLTIQNKIQKRFPQVTSNWLRSDVPINQLVNQWAEIDRVIQSRPIYPELIKLNDVNEGRPVFWIHGALGGVESFTFIAQFCDRPVYGIQARGAMTEHPPIEGIDAIANYYLEIIKSVQPEGPYDLAGYCLGGIIAYDISRKLQLESEKVNSLVMVDSPDNESFNRAAKSSNIPLKGAALQVANMLLWPAQAKDQLSIVEPMIHQNEIDEDLPDDEFITSLADLIKARGNNMERENIRAFIEKNVEVQIAYKLLDYRIKPLQEPEKIKTIYFRNAGGKFFGFLEHYFQTVSSNFCLDNVDYWSEWKREMPEMNMVDLDTSNHMCIMNEETSKKIISSYCGELYQLDLSLAT